MAAHVTLGQSQYAAVEAAPVAVFVVGLAALALVAASVFLLRQFRRRSQGSAGAEGACGHCGYLVRGLTTFTCPECGSDLRQVGITRRRGSAPAGPPRWPLLRASVLPVAVWLVGGLIVIAIVSPLIRRYLWPHVAFAEGLIDAIPRSGRYESIRFYTRTEASALGHERAAGTPRQQKRIGRIEIQSAGRRYAIDVDYLANEHSFSDLRGGRVVLPGTPTPQSILEFLKDKGVDTSGDAVRAEAEAAAALMNVSTLLYLDIKPPLADFPFDVTSYGSHAPIVYERPSFDDVQNVAWPALLLGGSAAIVWRRRKRLRGAGVGSAPAAPATAGHHGVSRTLTILFSDIKDYTARTAAGSRQAAIELVRRHRDVVQPIAGSHRGRIVKSIGDALLLTFDSATDALLAGLEIQSRVATQNAEPAFSDAAKLELRIAVCTGEVVVEEGDVYGEAVNLASRLQQHATPGEVLFGESTRVLVNGREVRAEEAGTFELKGVPEPVRAWRAVPQRTTATA
jgi:class 3 adenylate cyclase